jgi:hypothetical protein
MSKKPDNASAEATDNERATIELGRRGKWIDFDETEQPAQTGSAPTLAFLDAPAGVNFVKEFVRQYAEQQDYSEERTRLLDEKAHDAVTRYQEGRQGAKLRLVSHIDGLAIDDPNKRHREAFWMLTSANEFNAFLEAIDEPARWHDPAMPVPKPILETPSKFPKKRTEDALDKPIDEAIREADGVNAVPKTVIAILTEMANPTDGSKPKGCFTGLTWVSGEPHWDYQNYSKEPKRISKRALEGRIARRLREIRRLAATQKGLKTS